MQVVDAVGLVILFEKWRQKHLFALKTKALLTKTVADAAAARERTANVEANILNPNKILIKKGCWSKIEGERVDVL